ncbi:phosphatases II [Halteromyces radiatus]|uniref:phosphatases II n=1 Tax=Halteromyces radiatus TaxID=101107 RepID=UPI00221F915B|nr:phosphatases II [Halteromyces radiatus]KAI8083072.1 phosphatases II [Halteromyces radiatus]
MDGNHIDKRYFVEVFENCSLDDWQYEMRREMQELLPGLYLGPFAVCRDVNTLKSHGVTHILCLLDGNEVNLFQRTLEVASQFNSHIIEIADTHLQLLITHFPVASQFIRSGIDHGGKVLICCNGGMSRSPCFAIAYIMETFNISFRDAYQFVQARRLCINPNEAFKSQLKEYEPIYMAAQSQRQQSDHQQQHQNGYTIQQRQKRTQLMDDHDGFDMDDMRSDTKRRDYSSSSPSTTSTDFI